MKPKYLLSLLLSILTLSFAYTAERVERPGAGYALQFDGTKSLQIPTLPSSYPFSIDLWYKWDGQMNDSNENTILFFGNETDGLRIFHDEEGRLQAEGYLAGASSQYIMSAPRLGENVWTWMILEFRESGPYKVVTTYNGDEYAPDDGIWSDLLPFEFDPNNGFTVGSEEDSFHGVIDDIRIWEGSRAINAPVGEQLSLKLEGTESGLFRYLRFDQGSGVEVYDYARDETITSDPTIFPNWQGSSAPLGDKVYRGVSTYSGDFAILDEFYLIMEGLRGYNDLRLYNIDDAPIPNVPPGTLESIDPNIYFGYDIRRMASFGVGSTTGVGEATFSIGLPDLAFAQELGYDNVTLVWRATNFDDWEEVDDIVFEEIDEETSGLSEPRLEWSFSIDERPQGQFALAEKANSPVLIERPGSGYALAVSKPTPSSFTSNSLSMGAITNMEFTIESWIKWNGGASAFFSQGGGDTGFGVSVNDAGIVSFGINANGATKQTFNINQDEWMHLAFVFQNNTNGGTDMIAYRNGLAVGSMTGSYNAGRFFALGGGTTTDYWADELRIWSEPLSQTEIREGMAQKFQPTDTRWSELLHYYRFDEGPGSTSITDLITNGTLSSQAGIYPDLWSTSGAPIGDESVQAYPASNLSTTTTLTLDNLTLSGFRNVGNRGLHLYKVNELPNNATSVPFLEIDSEYYGYFIATTGGVTVDQFNISLAYDAAESFNLLGERENNADADWVDAGAIDNTADEVFEISTSSISGEFILAEQDVPVVPVQTPGPGYALTFDGTQSLTIPGIPVYSTIRMWIKWDGAVDPSTGENVIVSRHDGQNGYEILHNDLGEIIMRGYSNGAITERNPADFPTDPTTWPRLVPGKWVNLSIWRYNFDNRLDVGILAPEQPLVRANNSFRFGTPTSTVTIGNNGNGFSGQIDELSMWEGVLPLYGSSTIEELEGLFLNLDPNASTDLVRYFRFDRGAGAVVDDYKQLNSIEFDPANGPTWIASNAPIGEIASGIDARFRFGFTGAEVVAGAGRLFKESDTEFDYVFIFQVDDAPEPANSASLFTTINQEAYWGYYFIGSKDETEPQSWRLTVGADGLDFALGQAPSSLDLGVRNNPDLDWTDPSGVNVEADLDVTYSFMPAADLEHGQFLLAQTDPPLLPGETIDNPIIVGAVPFNDTRDMEQYSNDGGQTTSNDVWYLVNVPACGIQITVAYDVLAPYSVSARDADDNSIIANPGSRSSGDIVVRYGLDQLTPGEDYLIAIEGSGNVTVDMNVLGQDGNLIEEDEICATSVATVEPLDIGEDANYSWTRNGVAVASGRTLTTSEEGVYQVTYTEGSCTVSDEVIIYFIGGAGTLSGPATVRPAETFQLVYDRFARC